jgi:hypothetical protein
MARFRRIERLTGRGFCSVTVKVGERLRDQDISRKNRWNIKTK